jgi:hypothetical protein
MPFHGGPRVEVRPRVEDVAVAIEEHAPLALARRHDGADACVGRQFPEGPADAARERRPETLGVEVEAADHRDVRVDEAAIDEAFLGLREHPPGAVEHDATAGPRPRVERDDHVHARAQPRRS